MTIDIVSYIAGSKKILEGDTKTPKKRDVYYVTPNSKGGGDIQKEGNKRPSGHFKKKPDAIARGKELAKKAALRHIKIYKQDGTIQVEHTYGK